MDMLVYMPQMLSTDAVVHACVTAGRYCRGYIWYRGPSHTDDPTFILSSHQCITQRSHASRITMPCVTVTTNISASSDVKKSVFVNLTRAFSDLVHVSFLFPESRILKAKTSSTEDPKLWAYPKCVHGQAMKARNAYFIGHESQACLLKPVTQTSRASTQHPPLLDHMQVPLGHVHVHVIDGQLFAFGGDFDTPCSYVRSLRIRYHQSM